MGSSQNGALGRAGQEARQIRTRPRLGGKRGEECLLGVMRLGMLLISGSDVQVQQIIAGNFVRRGSYNTDKGNFLLSLLQSFQLCTRVCQCFVSNT